DRNARQYLLQRRLFRDVGVAEIAVQEPADPVEILDDDWLAEAEFLLEVCLVGGIDEARGGEQDVDDIAGHPPQRHENDDGDPEQGHEHQSEASHEISKHLASPSRARWLLSSRPSPCSYAWVAGRLPGTRLTCPSRHPRSGSRYRSCST